MARAPRAMLYIEVRSSSVVTVFVFHRAASSRGRLACFRRHGEQYILWIAVSHKPSVVGCSW